MEVFKISNQFIKFCAEALFEIDQTTVTGSNAMNEEVRDVMHEEFISG